MSISVGERASVRRGFAGGLLGISADFDDLDRKLAVSRPTFFTCDLAGLRETQAKALAAGQAFLGEVPARKSVPPRTSNRMVADSPRRPGGLPSGGCRTSTTRGSNAVRALARGWSLSAPDRSGAPRVQPRRARAVSDVRP